MTDNCIRSKIESQDIKKHQIEFIWCSRNNDEIFIFIEYPCLPYHKRCINLLFAHDKQVFHITFLRYRTCQNSCVEG